MASAPTLSIDARKWLETIEAGGSECLCSPVSAKNVAHVLSNATVRGPQKQLCAAVAAFVPEMLKSAHGISILTSLVCYGTPATVEAVTSKLASADAQVWSFDEAPPKDLTKALSHLLERLVYREDCTGDSYKAMLDKLRTVKKARLFASAFTLPAAARLSLVDPAFAKAVVASTEAQKAFAESAADAVRAPSAEAFCRTVFEAPNAVANDFVWKALTASLKATSKAQPRENVLAILAARAPVLVVNKLSEALVQWPNLHELCERDVYMQLVAHLLERTDDDKVGNKLVAAVIKQDADITSRMESRKTAPHHLLAALTAKASYANTLEKTLGQPQTKRLTAAKVRFVNATQPKATATQQAILQKFQKLSTSGAGAKRARE